MLFRKNKDEYDLFSQLDNYLIQHKTESDKNDDINYLTNRFGSKIINWDYLRCETKVLFANKKRTEPIIPDDDLERKMLKRILLEEIESYKKQNPYFYKELFLFYDEIKSNTSVAQYKRECKQIIERWKSKRKLYRLSLPELDYPNVYDALDELLKHKEEEFRALLMLYMRQNNIKNDREWYAYTHITKHDLSKYKSGHHPSRDNTLKLAFGLHLSLEETQAFLSAAGYSLSSSCRRDIIIKFCIEKGINTRKTDDLLMHYNEKILFG